MRGSSRDLPNTRNAHRHGPAARVIPAAKCGSRSWLWGRSNSQKPYPASNSRWPMPLRGLPAGVELVLPSSTTRTRRACARWRDQCFAPPQIEVRVRTQLPALCSGIHVIARLDLVSTEDPSNTVAEVASILVHWAASLASSAPSVSVTRVLNTFNAT
jgi:hypothetical protein